LAFRFVPSRQVQVPRIHWPRLNIQRQRTPLTLDEGLGRTKGACELSILS
jgi:hypothetical protein